MARQRTTQWILWALALSLTPWRGLAEPTSADAPMLPHLSTVGRLAADPRFVTASGKDIEVLEFRASATRPGYRFLVQGGLHGNEDQASAFVLWLARRYAHGDSALNRLPRDEVAIDFIPNANPDGTAEKSRYNAHGVNLNRNFGVLWGVTRENPGSASFSEPETRAIRGLFKARRYTAAVDVHGYINWVVAPSAPAAIAERGIKPTKRQRRVYGAWTESLRDEMPLMPGYQLKTGAALGDGGAFEDWAFWSEGTLAYCLEIESLQRFVPSYRADFADLTRRGPKVDTFKRYEMFVYRMFAAALKLRQSENRPESLVAD